MGQTEDDKDTESFILAIANLIKGGARIIGNSLVLTNQQVEAIHRDSKKLFDSVPRTVEQTNALARERAESELRELRNHLGYRYGDFCRVEPESVEVVHKRDLRIKEILKQAGIDIDAEPLDEARGNRLFSDVSSWMFDKISIQIAPIQSILEALVQKHLDELRRGA